MCWICLWGVPSVGVAKKTYFWFKCWLFRVLSHYKTAERISLLRSYPHNAWSFGPGILGLDLTSGLGWGFIFGLSFGFGFYLNSHSLFDVIYGNLCSVNVAGRLVDRCLSLRSRSTDAGCLYKRSGPDPRFLSTIPAPVCLSLGISTVFGTAASELCLSTAAIAFIIDLDPSYLHDLRATRLKRPIDRMFYGCQIQLLQYSKWFAPSCASPPFPRWGALVYTYIYIKYVETKLFLYRAYIYQKTTETVSQSVPNQKQPMPKWKSSCVVGGGRRFSSRYRRRNALVAVFDFASSETDSLNKDRI